MDFTIGEKQFRSGKLDAMKQFHVSRRIAPIIPTLVPIFVKVAKDGGSTGDIEGIAELLGPFAEGIASLSDESSEYVISTCLSVVRRQTGANQWAFVWNQQGNTCMFDDMDIGDIIQIVVKVISESLGPFIQGLLTSQASSPEQG